jgi:hypothetical protein
MEPEVSLPHSQMPGANDSVGNVTKIKYTIFTGKYLAQYPAANRKRREKIRKKIIIYSTLFEKIVLSILPPYFLFLVGYCARHFPVRILYVNFVTRVSDMRHNP